MKTLTLIAFSLFATAALADEPAKEPDALAKARKQYEADIKAAVDPITAAYLKRLDRMMKEFGAAGDLDSAKMVQDEIKRLMPKNIASKIVGKWTWPGGTVEFYENGTMTASGGNLSRWTCMDQKTRKYKIVWRDGGNIEFLQMSADGSTLACKNGKGKSWTAERVSTDR